MKKNIALKTAFLVLGIVIGAGFASGKEIVTFFLDYAVFLPVLMILMAALIYYIIYISARVGGLLKPAKISDMTKVIFGKYYAVIDLIAILNLFISTFAMLAGADALAGDVFTNYAFPYFSILLSILVVIIVMGGIKSLLSVNSMVVPFMIGLVVLIPILFFILGNLGLVSYNTAPNFFEVGQGFFSTLLYVCMNMFTVSILVAQLGPMLKNKLAVKTSFLSSIILTLCVTLVLVAILNSSDAITGASMPMVLIGYELGDFWGGMYSATVLLGIFTTLIASSFALDAWLKQFIRHKVYSILIIISLAFIISRLGFAQIVAFFYPISGMFGFIFIFGVILFYYKNRKEISKLD